MKYILMMNTMRPEREFPPGPEPICKRTSHLCMA